LKERLHCLKHEGPEKLLGEFQGLQRQYPQAQAVSGNLAYPSVTIMMRHSHPII
jgi:hypothetical protein